MVRGFRIIGGAMSGEKSLPLRVILEGPVMLLILVLVLNSCFTPPLKMKTRRMKKKIFQKL